MRAAWALVLLLAACDGAASIEPAACDEGTLGCACAEGDACGTTPSGEPLACRRGICLAADCDPGESGCVCLGGTSCTASTDTCEDGVCRPEGCADGEQRCACLGGTCARGLYCDRGLGGGTCVDDTGHPGGACLVNGLCHDANRCDVETRTCVSCEPGTQGCLATASGACNAGLVVLAGRCLAPHEVRPDEPRCYTRCRGDARTEDGVRTCDADGFIEGCLDGYECVDGTCVEPGGSAPSCASDADCPDFQACLHDGAGRHCYANCESAQDCGVGLTCDRHVCRVPCERATSAADECPAGHFCHSIDGTSGVCRELAREMDGDPREVRGTFTLSTDHVQLGSAVVVGEVQLSTDSLLAETFEVVRQEHRAYDATGALVDAQHRDEGGSPLGFVSLRVRDGESASGDAPLIVVARPSCGLDCPVIEVQADGAMPERWARWEGALRIRHPELGERDVSVVFARGASGRWSGVMRYFGSFPDRGLDELAAARGPAKIAAAQRVQNGLVQVWGAYRSGALPGRWSELSAILTATDSESWRWRSVQDACRTAFSRLGEEFRGACYLYDGAAGGLRRYVSNVDAAPIPTGAVTYPIAIDLQDAPTGRAPHRVAGVIDSAVALHYAGSPAIEIAFTSAPGAPGVCPGGECVVPITSLRADIHVGGRAPALSTSVCGADAVLTSSPWLVPELTTDTIFDPETGGRARFECRDRRFPYPADPTHSASLTGGNPVPDGHAMHRRLRALDGALVGADRMFVLFEEHLVSRADPEGTRAYGYLVLERSSEIALPDAVPSEALAEQTDAPMPLDDVSRAPAGPVCERTLVQRALGAAPSRLTDEQARVLAGALITGVPATRDGSEPHTYPRDDVFYLCVDTGRFYGGPSGLQSALPPECPDESNVRFFTIADPVLTPSAIVAHSCQDRGACGEVLDEWAQRTRPTVAIDPVWLCEGGATYCSEDRDDLRAGKVFFEPREDGVEEALFPPLSALVQDAFRYRSRFQSDEGDQLGFAPTACEGTGYSTPYCYDPALLEEVLARTDCLLALYLEHADPPGTEAWRTLRGALSTSMGMAGPSHVGPLPDGFERLYAELLVVLGDEAHTRALRSRFDIAAESLAAFPGSALEENGVDLTGIAGYEMRSLYQAVQYFQLATDRFYRVLAPVVEAADVRTDVGEAGTAVITQELVTGYLERLIGASTKKARAWAEIATRYQSLARSDLARRVLERAYSETFLESVILSRLMLRIADRVRASQRAQIVSEIEQAQRRYRVALGEMREVHATLRDDVNAFGFAPDYVPLPAVDESDTRFSNAFEAVLGIARLRAETARRYEDDAIASNRSFETDEASFQAELVRIALAHEQRLGQVCGGFRARDGRVYPAIRKYAPLSERTAFLGDPCGMVGNGELSARFVELMQLRDEQRLFRLQVDHLFERMADEQTRLAGRCDLSQEIADFQYEADGRVVSLEGAARNMRNAVSGMDRAMNALSNVMLLTQGAADCMTPWECITDGGALSLFTLGSAIATAGAIALETTATQIEIDADRVRIDTAHWVASQECRELTIESEPIMRDLWRQVAEHHLEALQFQHRFALIRSEMERLHLEAQRIQEEQHEAEELAVDIERSRNDPNVRVYRNASVMTADDTFRRALEHAYRATRMFEYYTSQSYERAGQLHLIRMVAHDFPNLDSYLDQLEDDYEEFRVRFRTRARRVQRISVADHVFQIPFREGGVELTTTERRRRFYERLTDPRNLDPSGAWTVPFSTSFERLSPCTFNHQIEHIEVQLEGTGFGDDEADLLIWQEGTGTLRTVAEGNRFHRLPPSLIVANPYFNRANTVFDPTVYRRHEMRERPFVNTNWRLVFDQLQNIENRDIDLTLIEDIVLYVYYTDFTDPNACR
ncbi:hypothetical protein [Sandaracinus amylolyticus]|uniref:hypothetical protein n=1 Tax=Sandaracinus amylolyticus TaxID=927083 RepID=UPI001F37E4ED|nr:hypothetical protein [Sandaracinus amylolyticus]